MVKLEKATTALGKGLVKLKNATTALGKGLVKLEKATTAHEIRFENGNLHGVDSLLYYLWNNEVNAGSSQLVPKSTE